MTTKYTVDTDPVTEFGDWLAEREPAQDQVLAVDRIQEYERLKGRLEAAQARETVRLEQLRIAQELEQQVPKAHRGKGLGTEVGFARSESPARGKKHLELARTLGQDLPHTFEALTQGTIREEHAQAIAKETEVLAPHRRKKVDQAIKERLGTAGPRELANEARAHAQKVDSKAAAERHKKAKSNRRVTVQPSDDGMAKLTAYGPAPIIQDMVNRLRAEAKTQQATGKARDQHGKTRTRDQLMFDNLSQWGTGTTEPTTTPVELVIMMTPETLLAHGDTPAWLAGHGPIPAAVARQWLADEHLNVTLRRLFTDPSGSHLVGLESRGRRFPEGLRKMVLLRDNTCRSPYCEAPIIDNDHITPYRQGGATSWQNVSGLCGACNQTKENRDWKHEGDAQTLRVTTPTGHTYTRNPGPLIPGFVIPPEPPPKPRTTTQQCQRIIDRYQVVSRMRKAPPKSYDRGGAQIAAP